MSSFHLLPIFLLLLLLLAPHLSSKSSVAAQPLLLNDSISLSNLSTPRVQLNAAAYGGSIQAYIFRGNSTANANAWLCFVGTPSSGYTFSIYVYPTSNAFVTHGAIVWTANRQKPLKSGNFSLNFESNGNLVLRESDGSLVWSTETANKDVVRAELGAETNADPLKMVGNLVLYNSTGGVVWQSFDHPTDTLMIYQRLYSGSKLLSWASSSDPSEGSYSLVAEPGGLALYGSFPEPEPYWIWGYYGLNDTFSVTHTCNQSLFAWMDLDGLLYLTPYGFSNASWPPFCSANLTGVPNKLPFNDYGVEDYNAVTILRLEYDGNLKVYTLGSSWAIQLDLLSSDGCLLPRYCGSYGVCTSSDQCACPQTTGLYAEAFVQLNSSNNSITGCQPSQSLTCPNKTSGSSPTQEMLMFTGIDYFSNKYVPPILNLSTNLSCRDECLQDCSCLAAFWHTESHACFLVDHQIESLQGSLNTSSYLAFLKVEARQAPASTSTSTSTSNRRLLAGLLSGLGGVLVLCLLTGFFVYRRYFANSDSEEEDDAFLDAIPGLPTRYSYKDLHSLTNGFSQKLGQGGFGAVYAGCLSDGTKVAVKQLESLRQGDKEFRAEVAIMGGIHHYHLVSLIGFCAQRSHKLLVYEYMENGSLDEWIFADKGKHAPLSWQMRRSIALGAARGLAYLHEECRERILHLDIKPQNILLDGDFIAKVADFGLSRLMERNETHVVTTMRGTPGYLGPEWLVEGAITEKCDVYSFGMVLMEILSGRRNLDHAQEDPERIHFPSWAFQLAQEGRVMELTNARIEAGEEEEEQVASMLKIAFLCVLEDPARRPSMGRVVQMLEGTVPVSGIQLSNLLQGLLSVLRNPSPLSNTKVDEALAAIVTQAEEEGSRALLSYSQISGR